MGVVRFTETGQQYGISTWLKWWLKTPEARARCSESSAGSAHSTLTIATLTQLPVPMPPLDLRTRLLRTMRLIERRMMLNTRIAACAMELADAHFARCLEEHKDATRPVAAIGDVGEVVGGMRRSDVFEGGNPVAWAAPAEVLRHRLAHLDRTDQTTWALRHAVCAAGTILVAPRPGGVETVVSRIPLVPGRGTLAVRIEREADRMWLLHELRSRSKELVSTAQGQQGREMSRKAFTRFTVSWPDSIHVREPFARVAAPLHERAAMALDENRVLEALITTELTRMAEQSKGRR
ncbi:restriction endonuclease subunit S [Streptomyces sp. NPDC006365]|uniref:restriction endonuclease subunit S n=1 Tax=Streptomyces sp. NPDC006365 TaxID=3364744 RepID=UPI0036B4EA21